MLSIPTDLDVLEKLVIHLATLYDQGDDCVDFDGNLVSDPDYDALIKELKKNRPDSSAFSIGLTSPSNYVPTGDLIKHDPPMTSISKADGDDKVKIYNDWIERCSQSLGYKDSKDKFAQSFKRDGVAIRIYYEKGKLVRAGLRPRDGINGIDVTANVQYVQGVPKKLSEPWTLAVTGELECRLDDFQKVQDALALAGEELRKNPRNHTYGTINQQKDPKKTKDGRISFIAYNIIGFDNASDYYTTEVDRAKWCNQVLKIPHVRVNLHNFNDLAKMEAMIAELDYEVDGIVLKVNDLEDQEQLGHSGDDPTGDPRGALAWKFAEEEKIAVVKLLEWNTGRTGRVTPKAVFEQGIQLAGTTVSQATCNNYGWASRMCIGVGTHVKVIKAGKIIPKVIEVVKNPVSFLDYPVTCPSCMANLEIVAGNDGNQELMCHNDNCAAKHVKTYLFYLTSLGAKGLGESALERIVGSGLVIGLDGFYDLTIDQLIATGEFTERQATLAIATIHMVKPVADNDKLKLAIEKARTKPKVFQAWQFFGALGISSAGKTAGKALIDHFSDFNKIRIATVEDLVEIDGIGETTAERIVDWFKSNSDTIDRLLTYVKLEYPVVGKFSGKTFVLTGSFDLGKSHYEKLIHQNGGKTSSSVGSKTDYVVAGPKAGSKLDAAKEKGITIIDVTELESMLV